MSAAPYALAPDFIERFGDDETTQLTDLANQGQSDDVLLLLTLKDASDEINTYLSRAYKLPLPQAVVIAPIVRACCDITRYRLYKDRPTDEVALRYKQSIQWLKDVASGLAVLVFDPPLSETQKELAQTPLISHGSYDAGVFGKVLDSMPNVEDLSWRD